MDAHEIYEKGNVALCINPDSGHGKLTKGKKYTVLSTLSETIGIIDDTGNFETHGIARFIKLD